MKNRALIEPGEDPRQAHGLDFLRVTKVSGPTPGLSWVLNRMPFGRGNLNICVGGFAGLISNRDQ